MTYRPPRPDRDRELELLGALTACDRLSSKEREAFMGMLLWLADEPRGHLSRRQREWAEECAVKYELDEAGDPAIRNRDVPRGKPVELPEVLRHLPKKPPTRRPRA